jgi:hypothetical protein
MIIRFAIEHVNNAFSIVGQVLANYGFFSNNFKYKE